MHDKSGTGALTRLTRRQWVVTYLAVLTAYAAALNRTTIVPSWARPERYELHAAGLRRMATVREAGGRRSYDVVHEGIQGRPVLLVTDSQGLACNWGGADLLFQRAGGPYTLRNLFDEHVVQTGMRYDTIVLWVGTAHFAGGGTVKNFVRGMDALVETAAAVTPSIILVGPMPYTKLKNRDVETTVARTDVSIREALPQLRARHPDLPLYDMLTYRERLAARGLRGCLQGDGVHITGRGYTLLAEELAPYGLRFGGES